MEYKFSDNINKIESSVGEILKYASMPGYITLSAGNPSAEVFPIAEIAEISDRILHEDPISVLQYNIPEGHPKLRSSLKSFLRRKYSIGSPNDDVVVLSGAQQGMDLLTKALCNRGDTIITESPSFVGALNCFKTYGVNLVGMPMQHDGPDLSALESAIQNNSNIKLIYTIPNFQNPTGITMSLKKRKNLYSIAKKHNIIILEDNPYGDLRYIGEDIPHIKTLDDAGIVVYVSSFSKVISPGIRTAYCLAPKQICDKLTVCKQCNDVHSTVWSQLVANEFLTKYDFDNHLLKLRKFYSEKYLFTKNLLKQYFDEKISYTDIKGGFFIWCTLPDNIDMPSFCNELVKRKVCVVPGTAFMIDSTSPCNSFRINFSTPSNQALEDGIKTISEVYSYFLKQ